MNRKFPDVQVERFADDAVVDGVTESQARHVRDAIGRITHHSAYVAPGRVHPRPDLRVGQDAVVDGQILLDHAVRAEAVAGEGGYAGAVQP